MRKSSNLPITFPCSNELEVEVDFSDVDPNLLEDNEKTAKESIELTDQSVLNNYSDLESSNTVDSKLEVNLKDNASRLFKKPAS